MPVYFLVFHIWGLEDSLVQQLCDDGTNATLFVLHRRLFYQKLKSLFNNVLGKDVMYALFMAILYNNFLVLFKKWL